MRIQADIIHRETGSLADHFFSEMCVYSIEIKTYGIKIVLRGIINQDEMIRWNTQSIAALEHVEEGFRVFVDMRELQPISRPAREEIGKTQRAYRKAGLARSVVILSSQVIKRQFEEIAKETGVYQWERYIDASTNPNWKRMGMDWIEKAIDPDSKPKERNRA